MPQLATAREAIGRALAARWREVEHPKDLNPVAVVIRHQTERDEDNTWETWVDALLAGAAGPRPCGTTLLPLPPGVQAISSVADGALDCTVRYELYGADGPQK